MTTGLHAVSSFRPLSHNAEIAKNQVRAITSWVKAFDSILLFGQFEPQLASPKTAFVDVGQYPSIATLLYAASECQGAACILNADIVVAEHLRSMTQRVFDKRAQAWTSRRYEYNPTTFNLDSAKVVDLGADIFCAPPWVWEGAYRAIPTGYRLGGGAWDSWVLGYLSLTLKRRFVDITHLRAVFHPKHEHRIRPEMGEIPRDKYIESGVGFPMTL